MWQWESSKEKNIGIYQRYIGDISCIKEDGYDI